MSLKIWLEILWWVITAVVVFLVLRPIHQAMQVWEFQTLNIVFIVALFTFTRHIFMFEHTIWARNQVFKIILILLMVPTMVFSYDFLSRFVNHIGDIGWENITGHLPAAERKSMENYIYNELMFFGVGTFIAAPILAVRLFKSIWMQRNRNTV